jgi:hypothetical protein
MPELAEGEYWVKFFSTLDKYSNLDTTFTIMAGEALNLPDSIVMPLKIPVPTGFTLDYDTLKQIVTLSWDAMDPTKVSGYNVYRQHAGGADSLLTAVPITDTFFVDSTGIQVETYIYSLASVNLSDEVGVKTDGENITILSALQFLKLIGSSGTAEGEFENPCYLTKTQYGHLLIEDRLSNGTQKIILIDTSGNYLKEYTGFTTLKGGLYAHDSGQFFVMENEAFVRLYDTSGNAIIEFGGEGNDTGQFSTTSPWDIAIAPNKNLYIVDSRNNRIQIFNTVGVYEREISINSPFGIDFISDSELLISWLDTDNTWKISITDTNGIENFTWNVRLYRPSVTPGGNVVGIVGEDSQSPEIHIYNLLGELLLKFGKKGDKASDFSFPRDLTVFPNGRIYISDNFGKKIMVFQLPEGM